MLPVDVRQALERRSGGVCEVAQDGCAGRATDAHHRVRKGAGGRRGAARQASDGLSNLVHACRACHSLIHSWPAASRDAGWLLGGRDVPPLVDAEFYAEIGDPVRAEVFRRDAATLTAAANGSGTRPAGDRPADDSADSADVGDEAGRLMSTVDGSGGAPVVVAVDAVVVVVRRVDAGLFRLSVRCVATGVEVPELARCFLAEGSARRAAGMAASLFGSGLSVTEVLDMLAVFAPAPDCAGRLVLPSAAGAEDREPTGLPQPATPGREGTDAHRCR